MEFFQPGIVSDTDNAIPILSAGNASRDYWSLIKAVDSSGVHVVIAADSEWHPAPIGVANSPIPHNVWIGSAGNYTTLRSWYERASVVVVPLYPVLNACGYSVIAEAMAMGKPVIATRTFCHSDLLLDNQTGCYVQPLDSEAIMRKLSFMLNCPDAAREMGRCGRARMERWFSNLMRRMEIEFETLALHETCRLIWGERERQLLQSAQIGGGRSR